MRFNYTVPVNNFPAFCDIERNGNVVIATELEDNLGMSITNAVEWVASQVCRAFNIEPSRLVWFEHYSREDTHDIVIFDLPEGTTLRSTNRPSFFRGVLQWAPVKKWYVLDCFKAGRKV